ncbi:MAG: FxsA family protein [Spirochaeta sp.]|nr:FxsA family protein [Spirochaeta sp.]
MSPEWLFAFTHRSQLIRSFSLLTGLSTLVLADGFVLIRLARLSGAYLALALEGAVTLVAVVIVGSTVNGLIRTIRLDAGTGTYRPLRYARLAGAVIAGVLLVVPGFITDIVGLLLYLPPGRHLFAALFVRRHAAGLHRVHEYLTMEIFSTVATREADE